jgi:transcriptional regulator with XRE-family HTH domain
MPDQIVNHLRDLLFGGPGAPAYAPDGLLKKKGLSVESLARAAGLSRTSIYFYIENRKRPTSDSLHRICAALQIPFDKGLSYCTPSKVGHPARRDFR